MKYRKFCVIGSGNKFAGSLCQNKIIITYDSTDCFRVKEIDLSLKNPKLKKNLKLYGDMCLPISDFCVVCQNGKNKIIKENRNGL